MSTYFYQELPSGGSDIAALRRARAAGFEALDFCMTHFSKGKCELMGDNWEAVAAGVAEEAARLGITFNQSHLPFPKPNIRNSDPCGKGGEKNEFMRHAIERAIRVAAMLGVKWGVIHPVQNLYTDEQCREADIAYNHEIYDDLIELALKLGVGIAYENMADIDGRRRFGTTPEELIALVESYDSENVQICWDFGHVNRCFNEPTRQLRKVAKYLRATHVDDNIGVDDLHTIPFFGTVPWPEIMRTLREINYTGDFNYELRRSLTIPDELLDVTAKYFFGVGQYLLSL